MNPCRRIRSATRRYLFPLVLGGCGCLAAFTMIPPAVAAPEFEDVTAEAGIAYTGQSWGSSWGDFNGDGWPDLWTSNHSLLPSLYINQKDGTFADHAVDLLPADVWSNLVGYDLHGAAWADFDNDGDQDLVSLADGGARKQANFLFINQAGESFTEDAVTAGVDLPDFNARMPLWYDGNGDGLLDLLMSAVVRSGSPNPSVALFEQQAAGVFTDTTALQAGLSIAGTTNFGFLSELNSVPGMDIGISAQPPSLRVFDIQLGVFSEQTLLLGLNDLSGAVDVVTGDLTGNLRNEVAIVRGPVGSDVVQTDAGTVESHLAANKDEKGFTFESPGAVQFSLYPKFKVHTGQIFLGSSGVHPGSISFTVSADDPLIHGQYDYQPGVDKGVYISLDPVTGMWRVVFSNPGFDELNIVADSDAEVTGLEVIGFDPDYPPRENNLLVMSDSVYFDEALLRGFAEPASGRNIALGDFDNDMDLDMYVVATGPVENQPNTLFENQGNGYFSLVPNAGGAAGSLQGRGDSVSVADYDMDGFLDLFVTNGVSKPPYDRDGPYQLFRNIGNGNHWIQIELEGIQSNRDGIGAKVSVLAGGMNQIREQSGGIHSRAQDLQRLHFGLADKTRLKRIDIEWPGGAVQSLTGIRADEIIHVIEPGVTNLTGKPGYTVGHDEGVFIWKDSFDGPYHLRTNGDGANASFDIRVLSNKPLVTVVPVGFENNDRLALDEINYFSFTSFVNVGQDGLDFTVAPGSKALIAVEQDGMANPRQLKAGALGGPLSPAGWIMDAAELPAQPTFEGGKDLGLFVGNIATSMLRAQWNSNHLGHLCLLELFSSQPLVNVMPFSFEATDEIETGQYHVKTSAWVDGWYDGVDIELQTGSTVGLVYNQDGLDQPYRVNPAGHSMGPVNAYWLPRAEPYGQPQYDPATEAGVYLWKDDATNTWHVRMSAGGSSSQYIGELGTDASFTSVTPYQLESSDVLDTTSANRIAFNVSMVNRWEDGFQFKVPAGAALQLNLTRATIFSGDPAQAVQLGEGRWPVTALPVDIGGW